MGRGRIVGMGENIASDPGIWQIIWDFAAEFPAMMYIIYVILVLAATYAIFWLVNGLGHQLFGLPQETQLVPKTMRGVIQFVKSAAWRSRLAPIATSPSGPSRLQILSIAVPLGVLYGLGIWALTYYVPKSAGFSYPTFIGLVAGFLMTLALYRGTGKMRRR